jgi:hypothetical protein
MLRKLIAAGVFALVLAPSAYLAWTYRAMPHLGFYHDDSLYFVSAKSLAAGNGYRIASLPGEPYQTKYPPLYAALLAIVWKINPNFPSNLPIATLMAWLLLPAYLAMVWLFLKRLNFSGRVEWLLVLVATLSPIAAVFSFSLMPELLFTALLLASVLLAERSLELGASRWLPVLAGICGALAYLTKSAALPLLLTAPICFVWRKQLGNAMRFFLAMLPAVIGWQWFVSQHLSRSWDLVTLYYTNYVGFQIYNVSLDDLPLVIWHNLDAYLMGVGKLLTFDIPVGSKHLERVIAIAAIAGCVRLARKTRQFQYPLAALAMSALLLVWHYTPDQRFVFPMYPLLLAGLWTELANVGAALKTSWKKPAKADRTAAAVGAGLLAALALFIACTTVFGLFKFLPDLFDSYRIALDQRRPAYEWISSNAPQQATVFAYDDPVLYLYTGRKSLNMPIPTKLYYREDDAGIDKLLQTIPEFARQYNLGYALLMHDDFYRDLHETRARFLSDTVQANRAFQKTFETPALSIYSFHSTTSSVLSPPSGEVGLLHVAH